MLMKYTFSKALERVSVGALEVDYWGTEKKTYGKGKPYCTLVLKDEKVMSEIVRRFELGFGEAYMDDRVEIKNGDMLDLMRFVEHNRAAMVKAYGKRLGYQNERNAKDHQKRQIQSHYDVGNDFYKLWLDDTMTYTCAYYRTAEDSLEQAQRQKIDHVLRKLQLEKGHEFVDIGCGWGHLVVRAAKLYGAKGLGVTLSREQYEFATALAKREGVEKLATFKQMNYQDLLPTKKQYDRVVSMGILEHVGRGNLHQYFDVVNGLLKPGGVSVLHSITQQTEIPVSPWIDKYIFPGGYIPSQREILATMAPYDFRVIDLENIRPHYALTLREWLKRFEEHLPEIKQLDKMYDDRFIRMWRLYLMGSIDSFENGSSELSQIIFTKGIAYDLPLTREYLYK